MSVGWPWYFICWSVWASGSLLTGPPFAGMPAGFIMAPGGSIGIGPRPGIAPAGIGTPLGRPPAIGFGIAMPGGSGMPGGICMPGGIRMPACMPGGQFGAYGFGASMAGVFGASRSMLPSRTIRRMLPRRCASAIGSTPGSSRVETTSSGPMVARSWYCGSGR